MSTYVQSNLASMLVIEKILEGLRLLMKEVIAPFNLGQQDFMVDSGRKKKQILTYAAEVKAPIWGPGRSPAAVLQKVSRQFLELDWSRLMH